MQPRQITPRQMKIWQVDAFATEVFSGNPAAVLILDAPLSDSLMLDIAREMALSETAFVFRTRESEKPLLRWFTPVKEVDLCGHATLAAAHIYLNLPENVDKSSIVFETKWAGDLTVRRQNHVQAQEDAQGGRGYVLDFPARPGERLSLEDVPEDVLAALGGHKPLEAFKARDLMLVYADESLVRGIKPDFSTLGAYPSWVIVTAPSDGKPYDFISRFFCADDGINEDPVTGSAHTTLGPYWGRRLGKTSLLAWQASARGGRLGVELVGDRVHISGAAVTVMEGILNLGTRM